MKTPRATTTLGDLHRATPWLWLNCERCQHHAPLACAVAVIRWGRDASSDVLRQRARCTACGHKGATIQHPGWGGADVRFLPFPKSGKCRCGHELSARITKLPGHIICSSPPR